LFEAVARFGHDPAIPLSRGRWWEKVRSVLDVADEREALAVQAATDSLDDRLQSGSWHGDLAPWNMFSTRAVTHVIDWEFAAHDVPFGFDLCHFHVQTGMELVGLDAPGALRRAERRSRVGLVDLGVPPGHVEPIWQLYLVELVRRQLELRGHGVRASVSQGPAALAVLEDLLAGPRARHPLGRRDRAIEGWPQARRSETRSGVAT
jgi:hypothetical protein